MWKKRAASLLSVILVSVMFAPGCATILRKSTQRIPITSSPAGAAVSVNGEAMGTTPLRIKLAKSRRRQIIRIESPGYIPIEIRTRRRILADPIVGNLLFGLLVGYGPAAVHRHDHQTTAPDRRDDSWMIWGLTTLIISSAFTVIDLGNGQAYEFKPKELVVTLTKVDGPARVDTILIDPEDLRNIRWIRVRRD